MGITSLASHPFAIFIPVALVIVSALLVFAFGFKSSVEPPSFKNISYSSDDKKNSKKKKPKDKKPQTNGHATVVIDVPESKKSPSAKQNKVETPKQKKLAEPEKVIEKKTDLQKSPAKKDKKGGEAKKKNQNVIGEKPVDFDEGEWETAPSRKEKKSKKKDEDITAAVTAALITTPERSPKKKATPAPKKEKPVEEIPVVTQLEVVPEPTPFEDVPVKPFEDAPELFEDAPIITSIESPAKVEDEAPKAKTETPKPAAPTAIAELAPVVTPTETESAEEQPGKKKKAKKGKTSVSEDDTVVPQSAPAVTAEEIAPAVLEDAPVVLNELEDAWKDAPQKKSKKKVRKD